MTAVQIFLGLSIIAFLFYSVASVIATNMWCSRSPGSTLSAQHSPPLTILKPVHGTDAQQLNNFRSFCRQNYPKYQIIFGALDSSDVALESARAVQEEFPDVDIKVISGSRVTGLNRKVCNLIQMLPHANYDLIVIADSDMRVSENYLMEIAAPFASNAVGLNTCPYRGAEANNIIAKFEAIGIGADFIPSAFVGYYVSGVRFAFGSTIVIRRSVLEHIGGFESIIDELADDYLLASKTRAAGHEVWLSNYIVEDIIGNEPLSEMWSRRLRWAKTSRAMQPAPYLGSYITHGFSLSLLLLFASRFSMTGLITVLVVLMARFATVARNAVATDNREVLRSLWLLPLSDLLSFMLFLASLTSSRIRWRDQIFRIGKGGKLTR